jgi:hypothetical protein
MHNESMHSTAEHYGLSLVQFRAVMHPNVTPDGELIKNDRAKNPKPSTCRETDRRFGDHGPSWQRAPTYITRAHERVLATLAAKPFSFLWHFIAQVATTVSARAVVSTTHI